MINSRPFLFIGFAVFSATFAVLYPTNYGIVDEAAYLTTTYAVSRSEIYYDRAGLSNVPMMVATPTGHNVSKYAPGNSLSLLPFAAAGWRVIFVRSWLAAGICLLLFAMLLAHYRIPRIYALLLLFFPPVVLYSRTIMSDLPAMLMALAGLYFFVTKRTAWAGVFSGLGIYFRYPMVLLVFAFAAALLARRETRNFLIFSAAAFLSLIPLLGYHLFIFRNILGPAFQYGVDLGFTVHWGTLCGFVVTLAVLYPLMLAAPFAYPGKERGLFMFTTVVYVMFHAFQSYIDSSADFLQSLVVGQRYLLPVIPFLLVPYAAVLDRLRIMRKLILPVTLVLMAACAFLQYRHAQFLKVQDRYQQLVYRYAGGADLLVCNKEVFELVNPYIKYLAWVPFEKQRKLIDTRHHAEGRKTVLLACIARDSQIRELFQETLDKYPDRSRVYQEEKPLYFSIWRVNAPGSPGR